jgi:hypothetical protein
VTRPQGVAAVAGFPVADASNGQHAPNGLGCWSPLAQREGNASGIGSIGNIGNIGTGVLALTQAWALGRWLVLAVVLAWVSALALLYSGHPSLPQSSGPERFGAGGAGVSSKAKLLV